MKTPARVALGVVTGVVGWGLLWNGGTLLATRLWPQHLVDVVPITHVGILLGYVLFSVLLSLLAGYATARIVTKPAAFAVQLLAAIQLMIGMYFQLDSSELFPAWYHVTFLALVIPATVTGGWLSTKGWGRR